MQSSSLSSDDLLRTRAFRVLFYRLNRSIASENKTQWIGGTPDDWSNESRALVLDFGYRLQFSDRRELSEGYIREGQTIVEEQLQRAGIRLAEMLNRLLNN